MPRRLLGVPIAIVVTVAAILPACGGSPEPPPAATSSTPVPMSTTPPRAEAVLSADAEANALLIDARLKRRDASRQGVAGAIASLEKAVRRDRKFVQAYAELAFAYGTLDDAGDPLVRGPRAKAAADRAVAIDQTSAPALAARAFVRYRFNWHWKLAESDFEKALESQPNDPLVRHSYGVFLATHGRTDEALRELERAAALEPTDVAIRADMVRPLLRAGRTADARAALNTFATAVRSGPLLERLEGEVRAAETRSPVDPATVNRRIRQLMAQFEDRRSPPASYRLATDLAMAHASLQHRDQTLHWLAVAIDLHEDAPLYMPSSPEFDFLRSDARFRELLRRAKFED